MRQIAALVKKHPALYAFLRQGLYARLQSARRKRIFLRAYKDNLWGSSSSASGPGSEMRATQEVRERLPALLRSIGVSSLLDVPCGDLAWMKEVQLGDVTYIGGDIVAPMIDRHRRELASFGTFVCVDLLKGNLPNADAVFCRDCLVHLSNREIMLALQSIVTSGATHLITTTFPHVAHNIDTVTPYWRAINLQAEPFNFPPPLQLIRDFSADQVNDQGKYLGLWRCSSVPLKSSTERVSGERS